MRLKEYWRSTGIFRVNIAIFGGVPDEIDS